MKFCVIYLVLMTSRGHEIKPAIIAAKDPLIDAEYTWFIAVFLVLKYSKRGSWIAEKRISLANVAWSPVYNPIIPLFLTIYVRLYLILCALPVISCCLTT